MRFMKVLLFFFIMTISTTSVNSQTYVRADRVNDIAVQGHYIWYATEYGLFRWDSRDMRCEHIISGSFFRVDASSSGTVVATGNNSGFHIFNGTNWTVIPNGSVVPGRNFSTNTIAPNGDVWVSIYRHGVARYDGNTWDIFTEDDLGFDKISEISIASNGSVWVGQYNGLYVSKYDDETWQRFSLDTIFENNGITSVVAGPDGSVWIGTGKGAVYFDGDSWTLYDKTDGLPSDSINSITIDNDGTPWFATYNGYFLMHFDGLNWTSTVIDGLARGLEFDDNGVLWAGVYYDKLGRFENGEWDYYRDENGPSRNSIGTIAVHPNGDMWVASYGGLSRYDGNSWITYSKEDGLHSNNIGQINITPDGTVWAGNLDGLSFFADNQWTTVTEESGLPANGVIGIMTGPDSAVWVCLIDRKIVSSPNEEIYTEEIIEGGVFRYNGSEWQKITIHEEFSAKDYFSICFDHESNLWVGTEDSIFKHEGFSWKKITNPVLWTNSNPIEQILAGPDGKMWISHGGSGIFWYENGVWSRFHVEKFNDPHEFFYNTRCLAIDSDGDLWFGASEGLFVFRNNELLSLSVGKEDGDPHVNCITFTDNRILIGTERGIYEFSSKEELLRDYVDEIMVSVFDESNPQNHATVESFPNPFNLTTTIDFSIPLASEVQLHIYNIMGQKIRTLVTGSFPAGSYTADWNGFDDAGATVSSGLYFARLKAGEFVETVKMTVVK